VSVCIPEIDNMDKDRKEDKKDRGKRSSKIVRFYSVFDYMPLSHDLKNIFSWTEYIARNSAKLNGGPKF